jgi:hypothetical protein
VGRGSGHDEFFEYTPSLARPLAIGWRAFSKPPRFALAERGRRPGNEAQFAQAKQDGRE